MGLFDSLFGGKKPEAPPAAERAAQMVASKPDAAAAIELDPKIPAAIAASVVNAAIAAAITAAVIHTQGSAVALRFRRLSNIWSLSGRQQIMASRQF